MGRLIDDNYSRNQCALMIRVDGDELYMPLNFNMRKDEIMEIYPYLLDMFNNPAPNPSLQFQKDDRNGKYKNLSEKERRDLILNVKKLSTLWYNKAEESLLAIALRFAVDIKLRGIEELRHLFETVRPLQDIEVQKQMTDEEAEKFLEDAGLINDTDKEFDPGDEQDIPLGVAGGVSVNLYDSGAPEDYLNDELDAMESRLKVQDEFQQVVDGTNVDNDGSRYRSKYEQGQKLTAAQAKGGMLSMYQEDEGSVFDALDKADGLMEPKYDDDYQDFRSNSEPGNEQEEPDAYDDGGGLEDGFPVEEMPNEEMPSDEGEPDFLGFDGEDPEEEPDFFGPDEEYPDSGDEE